MRRYKLPLLLSIALALAASPCLGQPPVESLFTIAGYDYVVPATGSAHYLDAGDGWRSLGYVTAVNPYMLGPFMNFRANEYTYFIDNLTVTTAWSSGPYVEADFDFPANGRLSIFEDPINGGTHGTFGVNPPNPTAPPSFTDGVLILGGDIYLFSIGYDSATGLGGFEGVVNLDEGKGLVDIPEVERTRVRLYGGSLVGPPNRTVPQGYGHLVNVTSYDQTVVPVAHRTWGAVKALYR